MLYFCDTGNFGDDLNRWLWERLAPELLEERTDRLFLGIGTILGPAIPRRPQKFVLGSGWSGGKKPAIDDRWTIRGVRGPLTARGLGLPPEQVISDPALLVRSRFAAEPNTEGPVGFMPHHRSTGAVDWEGLCREHGLRFVDPASSVETVLEGITGCRTLLAEAMHGAIIADAFRVPWIPVRLYAHINEFKWRDWCGSIGLPYDPLRLRPIFANPPTPGERVAHLWKRTLAATPLGKRKWSRLPLRASHRSETERCLEALAAAGARSDHARLSPEPTLARRLEEQNAALALLRQDWA